MDTDAQHEREVRAARNQALFRAVNERIDKLNEAFAFATGSFTIACECADSTCVQMVEIAPGQYEAVRANPRHFAVAPGHVLPDVERVVSTHGGYVVVEKTGVAGETAEQAVSGRPQP